MTDFKELKNDEQKCTYQTKCIGKLKKALVDNTNEDPMFYTTLSGITAAVGLATNSPATVIGSMLLSPIGDIIVRLSLVLNFNAQRYMGKTSKNYSKEAFVEEYLRKLGIDTDKVFITDGNEFLLKGNGNPIEKIYMYRGRVYFKHKNNDNIVNYYGDVQEDFKNDGMKSLSMSRVKSKILENERQSILPWTTKTYLGKKYKFWDILGWGIVICLWAIVVGIICSVCFGTVQINQKKNGKVPGFILPTQEMIDRTQLENAYGMIFIAICSGIIVPEAVKNNNSIKMVGVGIATALLPPLVNIGMYIGLYLIKNEETEQYIDLSDEHILNAVITGSIIFLLNFVVILVIATIRLYMMCDSDDNTFREFGHC